MIPASIARFDPGERRIRVETGTGTEVLGAEEKEEEKERWREG